MPPAMSVIGAKLRRRKHPGFSRNKERGIRLAPARDALSRELAVWMALMTISNAAARLRASLKGRELRSRNIPAPKFNDGDVAARLGWMPESRAPQSELRELA